MPEYTEHAKRRMQTRKISEEAVEWVLEHYHNSRPALKREGALPAVIYVGEYRNRNLKVYVVRDTDPMVVTTAVWEGD